MATVVDLSAGGSLTSALLSASSYIPPIGQMTAHMTAQGQSIMDSFGSVISDLKERSLGIIPLQRELSKTTLSIPDNVVYDIDSIDGVFNANPIMQSCILGHPYIQTLYNEGYDLYDRETVPEDTVTYRESRSGMMQFEGNVAYVDEHISHGYEDLPTFTLDEKIILDRTYGFISDALLRQVIDDYQEDELE